MTTKAIFNMTSMYIFNGELYFGGAFATKNNSLGKVVKTDYPLVRVDQTEAQRKQSVAVKNLW